jgi:hypothetical protein
MLKLPKEVTMIDWKKKIDKFNEREELHQAEKKKEFENDKEKAEQQARIKLLERFQCHICHVRAQKPAIGSSMDEEGATRFWDDWPEPGDLWRCKICHELACADHFYMGICQECAEKL